jgi:molybdopterin/thiamine biosynthesis adenylyltransferase
MISAVSHSAATQSTHKQHDLDKSELERYGRQMLLPCIGVTGQSLIKNASVLLVGVGGLGSVAALLLAGSGVGTIGLVDHDTVAVSNLHRQVIHTEEGARIGESKVESARRAIIQYVSREPSRCSCCCCCCCCYSTCTSTDMVSTNGRLNSNVKCTTHQERLTPENAVALCEAYDVIMVCHIPMQCMCCL